MRKLLLIGTFAFLFWGCGTQKRPEPTRAENIRLALVNRDQSRVMVAAHRGDWRGFPENSVEAIQSAIDMGVDIVEIDVQMTSDSVLVLMHDATLDRMTGGEGRVSEWTYDSILTLRLKNRPHDTVTVFRVPTLEEAMLAAKGRAMLNLDKADRFFGICYALAEKTGTTAQIVMKGGGSPDKVEELYGPYLENIIYMPIVNLDKPEAEEHITQFIDRLDPAAFELLFKNDGNPLPKLMPGMIDGRALIWYNTMWLKMAGERDDDMAMADPGAVYGYLIDSLGCRMIQTDRPAELLDYLRTRGLHD